MLDCVRTVALQLGTMVMIGVTIGIASHGSVVVFYLAMLMLGFTALLFTLKPYFAKGGRSELGVARILGNSTASKIAERSLFFIALVLIGLSAAVLAGWMKL